MVELRQPPSLETLTMAKAKADAAEVEQIRLQERVPDEVEEHV